VRAVTAPVLSGCCQTKSSSASGLLTHWPDGRSADIERKASPLSGVEPYHGPLARTGMAALWKILSGSVAHTRPLEFYINGYPEVALPDRNEA
jgi:hypothetical protein